jgi:hypothetical protein
MDSVSMLVDHYLPGEAFESEERGNKRGQKMAGWMCLKRANDIERTVKPKKGTVIHNPNLWLFSQIIQKGF